MNEKLDALQALPIFRNITKEGLETMMDCFSAEFISVKKGEQIKIKQNSTLCMIEGTVSGLKKGNFFPAPKDENPYVALEDSELVILESHMLLYPCYGCCFFHAQLLQNMREDGVEFRALENE